MKFHALNIAHISTIFGLIIIDPHNDQLSIGLVAELVEHNISIAEFTVQLLLISGLSVVSAQVA